MVRMRDMASKARKHQQKPAVGWASKVAGTLNATPASSSSKSNDISRKFSHCQHLTRKSKVAAESHADAAKEGSVDEFVRSSTTIQCSSNKGRCRRTTVDDPCDLENLQRAFKLAADSKVAANMELSACIGDTAGKSIKEKSSPKRPVIRERSRRATVSGPCPMMENLQRAYKLAADSKVAANMELSACRGDTARNSTQESSSPKRPVIRERPRRATMNGPCPMTENLQRAHKLAADSKVAVGFDSSARSSDATVKSSRENSSPKVPMGGGRPRRATVNGPCPMENLQRAYKLAADVKIAADVNYSSARSSDATVKTDSKASSEMPHRLRNGDIDSSDRSIACEPPSPKSTKPGFPNRFNENPTRSRRATVGDPPSSVQMESLRNDRFKAATASKDVRPRFVSSSARSIDATVKADNKASSETPHRLRNGDDHSSDRTACEPPSPKSTKPRFSNRFNETTTRSRRATVGDPLSLAQMESLRRDRLKAAAASKHAGPKFVPPLRNYHDEEAIDLNASERTCFSSSSLESLSIGLGESARAPPPPRNIGGAPPSVLGEKKVSLKPRVGLLVRTEDELDESVSSLEESMRSNTTVVSRGSAVDDKEASTKSPFCVSDFEHPNEAHQTPGKSEMPSSSNVPRATGRASNISPGAIPVSRLKKLSTTRSGDAGGNVHPPGSQTKTLGKPNSFSNQQIEIDRRKARSRGPARRAAVDCGTGPHSRGSHRRRAGGNDGSDLRADYVKRLLKDHNERLDALMMRGRNDRRA